MEFPDLSIAKMYTYAGYLKWTLNERVELIKGENFKIISAPSAAHQRLWHLIRMQLGVYLETKPCEIFSVPLDVRLIRCSIDDKDIITVVQPAICVICDSKRSMTRVASVYLILLLNNIARAIIEKNCKTSMKFMKTQG